jgi:hypothetical protein
MPKVRMVMYCEIPDAGPDEPWLEKFVESFGSFPPGAVITTNVDQEVSLIGRNPRADLIQKPIERELKRREAKALKKA